MREALPRLVALLAVPFLIVLVWQGMKMFAVVSGQVAPATGLPAGWLYLAAPVGGALSLFFLAESFAAGRPPPAPGDERP
jgi:TRAP-type C4-dicarboxylate transport system permease small subunit